MKRLAIFVEGYTELAFVKRIVEEMAKRDGVTICSQKRRGGQKASKTCSVIAQKCKECNSSYYVLICDCGGEDLVKIRIREEYDNLVRAGYTGIIGLRDVRPTYDHSNIKLLRERLPTYIKTKPIQVQFFLSVMECEAWFLAELEHFKKIVPHVSLDEIKSKIGFDPRTDNIELRESPAADLNACYALGGEVYSKSEFGCIDRTVGALCMESVYLNVQERFADLRGLINSINNFFVYENDQ